MIRVAIVEDRPEISAGLHYIISFNNKISSKVFITAEAALNGITPELFDIVLMDIQLPKMSGIECTALLKKKYPDLKIMMCTVFEEDDKIFRAIAAGANGYFLKRSDPDQLLRAINELMAGGSHISSEVAIKVIKAFRQVLPDENTQSPLTEREQEVLKLLATGHQNDEVAENLSISVNTVKRHVYSIYQKLHVHSKVEAINKYRFPPK